MDSCAVASLTEDVFSHLCNVALEKCHDKNERRRAGCGGHSMRKRVLIKNFVADLLRAQNDRRSSDALSTSSDESWEEEEVEEETEAEEEREEADEEEAETEEEQECNVAETTPLPPLTPPQSRTFVDSDPSLSSLFPDYLDTPSEGVSVRDVSLGQADCKLSSEDRLWMYDMYGSESEQAITPSSQSPPSVWGSSTEWGSASYDGSLSSEDSLCPPTSLYDHAYLDAPSFTDDLASTLFSASAQPVRAEAQDQIFLSLSTNHLAEMKTYAPDMALPEDVITPSGYSMTDLDAPTVESSVVPQSCKRAAMESTASLYAGFATAKRIKL